MPPGCVDALYAREGRAFPAPSQHAFERRPVAFQISLDTVAGNVPHPAREAQSDGLVRGGVAKAHPLHEAVNTYMQSVDYIHSDMRSRSR